MEKEEKKIFLDPQEVGEIFRGLGIERAEEEALDFIVKNALGKKHERTN